MFALAIPVGTNDLWHAGEGRSKLAVLVLRLFKAPSAAEIIFGAGATDRRVFTITVDEKFNLAFAPPEVIVDTPGHIDTDKMSLARRRRRE